MYEPKTGDRVRVVLEGTVTELPYRVVSFGVNWGSGSGNEVTPGADHVVSIELLAPAEPPVDSVVRSKGGVAYQHFMDGWYAASEETPTRWGVLSGLAPTLLYTPDSE